MAGITVTKRNESLFACKAAPKDSAERLLKEAKLVERLAHPGIVAFAELVEGDDVEFLTDFVGPDTWVTQPPATESDAIAAFAFLASTVADLHTLNTAHGAIRAEHVLVSPDKRPILCGLADASPANDETRAKDLADLIKLFGDVGSPLSSSLRKRIDGLAKRARNANFGAQELTAELNKLHGRANARSTGVRFPRPSKRSFVRIPRPSRRSLALGGILAVIAFAVVALLWPGGEEAQPSLAVPEEEGADELAIAVPNGVALLPTNIAATPQTSDATGNPTAGLVGDSGSAGANPQTPDATGNPSTPSWLVGDEAFGTESTSGTTPPSSGIDPTDGSSRNDGAIATRNANGQLSQVEADGSSRDDGAAAAANGSATYIEPPVDGARDRATTTANASATYIEPPVDGSPRIVIYGGRRYGLGKPNDIVVLGDWNCSGEKSPALLDLDDGQVVVFVGWPLANQQLSASLTEIVNGAIGLRVPGDGSCGRLRVDHAFGSSLLEVSNLLETENP